MSDEQVRAMAAAIGLTIPDDELQIVAVRLSGILAEMELIEAEYGRVLDGVDPIPSVLIDEEALR